MTEIRRHMHFILNDRMIKLSEVGAQDTLLDFLRLDQRLTGTKEGCAEGDCGACTVMVGRLHGDLLVYETVNACIRFLATLDGCHVVTIEHLRGKDGALHPVQQAMVDFHGSQCGFCTPGIVFSLYALFMQNPSPSDAAITTALQGNLCRCTGYAPIIRAAKAMASYGTLEDDFLYEERNAILGMLSDLNDGARVVLYKGEDTAILPANVADLAWLLETEAEATIVAGGTDVGLWVTKFLRPITPALFIGHLQELKAISATPDTITMGAGVTYSEAHATLAEYFPHLDAYWNRIAGWQVRNMGTIGGNIANGSPIGDTPPVLIALGTSITLRKGEQVRTIPLEEFFIDYGKQDREYGDFLEAIHIPLPKSNDRHAAYKISKRRDEDISSVAAGFKLTVVEGVIQSAIIAFGGMAATPKRATKAEATLVGKAFSLQSLEEAADCLEDDFTPLSDWRASAAYRMQVAKNLFLRFWHDQPEGLAKGEAAE